MEPTEGKSVSSLSALVAMAAEEHRAARQLRYALGAAVGLHVVLFAIHWPTFATTSAEAEVVKPRIFVSENHLLKPPEVRPEEVPRVPPRTVPVPDPTPEDPEPLPLAEPESGPGIPFDQEIIPWDNVEPPPPDPTPVILRVGGSVSAPVKVGGPDPVYPELARKIGKQGVVILECLVDRTGRVQETTVLKGEPLGMTEAAVEAVKRWSFEPATMEGQPVDVLYILTVRFSLQRG